MIDTNLRNAYLILNSAIQCCDDDDIRTQVLEKIDFLNVYSVTETNTINKESIVCIVCDYLNKTDMTDYTASIYFRITVETYFCGAIKQHIERLQVNYMCMLDEH